METGRITKIISNQYTIDNKNEKVTAVPRGKMRKAAKPVVGDIVEYEKIDDTYRISKVLKRKNQLLRPAVSNVDQALIVTSCKDPDFSEHLLNRLIILVSLSNIEPVIVITKYDLLKPDEQKKLDEFLTGYQKDGYRIVYSYPGADETKLEKILEDKISVLCGQSGAGKSSLLNRLDPSFKLQTQQISKALGRGKHTTRHCELHKVADGLVADTPGFSSLDFSLMNLDDLDKHIKDFEPYLGKCRFSDCRHINEPDCAVKEAVENKEIFKSIYDEYVLLKTNEVKTR